MESLLTDLKLFWLGPPVIQFNDRAIHAETRKAAALLSYLSLSPNNRSRESLAALFWPEFDQTHAHANLRRALSSLNQFLGSNILISNRDHLGIDLEAQVWMDIREFHQHLAAVQAHTHPESASCSQCLYALEAAVGLYRGDFLEGLNLRDCPEFDDWQYFQREELRQELAGALKKLSNAYAGLGEWEKAIGHARRQVSLDRLDEPSQRLLIQFYAQSGQRSAALHQYEDLTQTLQDELGQSPSVETNTLIQQIRAGELEIRPSAQKGPEQYLQGNKDQPLIRTKLFAPPPRSTRVSRPRLLTQLDQASQYPLTLICAPAGYGKTTLLLEWVQNCRSSTIVQLSVGSPSEIHHPKIAWLSLDAGDNDSSRFLAYLVAALENAQPGISAETQLLLQSPQPLPPQTILAVLINNLQELGLPIWFILDDYQFITNPAIHESIIFLLEHLPAQFHLLIATRSDPPLPLHRYRARNQLLELRSNDLRFTSEEAAAFLNRTMDLSLSMEDVVTLENRTEGWIAGLQMAALAMQSLASQGPLSMQGRMDRSAFIRDFGGSHRYILEYLIEEILNRQPENIKTFLLYTSILDRLCKPLCDQVLENSEYGQITLAELERLNLFLTPLDDVGYWYRYHHLFADLLRGRVAQSQPELLPTLHLRASQWYEKELLPEEAIKHALAANALERAADLVEHYMMAIMNRGELSSLLIFIRELPDDLLRNHPILCLEHAWVLTFSGQIGEVEELLKLAESQIHPDPLSLQAREVLGSAAIIRGLIADLSGDMATAISLARKADALLSKENSQSRSVIPYVLGDGYFAMGQLDQAEQAYEKISQIGRNSGNLWTTLVALHKLSLVKKLKGKLHAAWGLYQEGIQLATEKKALRSGSLGATYVAMSELQREWNELEAAMQTATQAIKTMEHWPNPVDLVNGYVSLARIALSQCEIGDAEIAFHRAEEISRRGRIFPATRMNLESCQVQLWLVKGDQHALNQWVESRLPEEMGTALDEKFDYIVEIGSITLARGLIAQGGEAVDRAVRWLNQLAELSRAAGQVGLLIEILALLALAYQARMEPEAALKALKECLVLAQPEGYLRLFLDGGQPMRRLIQGLSIQVESFPDENSLYLLPYIRRILSIFPDEQGAQLSQRK